MGELLCAIEEGREPSNSARENLFSLALAFAAVRSPDHRAGGGGGRGPAAGKLNGKAPFQVVSVTFFRCRGSVGIGARAHTATASIIA